MQKETALKEVIKTEEEAEEIKEEARKKAEGLILEAQRRQAEEIKSFEESLRKRRAEKIGQQKTELKEKYGKVIKTGKEKEEKIIKAAQEKVRPEVDRIKEEITKWR